jgi:RNA recognition motif-containing protein
MMAFFAFLLLFFFLFAGCAFVTFTTRQSAINAIKGMHHSTTMEVSPADGGLGNL